MIDTIILCSVILLIIALNIVERYRASKRENDLFNRLMAKDFNNYVQGTKQLSAKPSKEKDITLSDLLEKPENDILPVD